MSETPSASPFVRVSFATYLLLIVYASWYPFSGWHADHLGAFVDVIRQWPRYWTWFDVITNVIGYIPLGVLACWAMYPFARGWPAFLLASVGGALLSATMESGQYFLPSRVTSLLDFLTNSLGTLLGALCGVLSTSTVLEKGRLRLLRKQWLQHEASREMLLLGLWPLAQIYPQPYLFGNGQVAPNLSQWLSQIFDSSIDIGALLRHGAELSAQEYWLAETIITACGATGSILLCLSLLTRAAPKFWLGSVLLLCTLTVKALALALLFDPTYAFAWLTPGAKGGLFVGALMTYGFSFTPAIIQRRLAALMLLLSLLTVNLIPANPYFALTLQGWVQGKFLNFDGAAQFLCLLWPFLALGWLTRKTAG